MSTSHKLCLAYVAVVIAFIIALMATYPLLTSVALSTIVVKELNH